MNNETDPVLSWLEKDISPAIDEASTLLYEFSRLELRDISRTHEMLWKISTLNHRLGLLYADAVELKNEFQTQCDELHSKVFLMLTSKKFDYKLTSEAAKAAGELATSNLASLAQLYPDVVGSLSILPGQEPKRRLNQLSSTVEKLKSIQRDMQESINGIKHLANRDLQHTIHGI